jgi:hypothetical protein
VSGRGTERRHIRIDRELWDRFALSAEAQGRDRASLIRDFVRWHAGDPDAELPERPPQTEPPSTD